MSYKVMSERCKTCIFGANSPISPARLDEYKRLWAAQDVAQECHTATIAGLDYGCKGHYEAAQVGAIPHPIRGIMAESFGLSGVSIKTSDLMQIAERLGLVEFVTIEQGVNEHGVQAGNEPPQE